MQVNGSIDLKRGPWHDCKGVGFGVHQAATQTATPFPITAPHCSAVEINLGNLEALPTPKSTRLWCHGPFPSL